MPQHRPLLSLRFPFSAPLLRRGSRGARCALAMMGGLFFAGLGVGQAKEIALGGSDLLAPLLTAPVAEFNRDNPAPLALKLTGTLPALSDVLAGKIALAVVALRPGSAPLDSELQQVPLAYVTVCFVMPQGGTVSQLTLDQVASIFGTSAGAGESRRWADLGFTGDWSAKSISTHAYIAPRSLSLELFRNVALRSPELRSSLVTHAGWPQLAAQMLSDEGAIALVSGPPPAGVNLKLVPVAGSGQSAAVAPTAENLHAGSYPFRLPFVVVFKSARGAEVFESVRFLLSEDIAEALARADLVAAPREVRNAALFELETRK